MIKIIRIRFFSTQIKRQHIINSSYEQLVDRIARTYNLKQYKNQSGLCLLEMHHQFNIFKPGDWVMDIGAGINYAWTDLALKLTQNQENSHMVISNDILDLRKNRQNNIFIKGNINEQPVKTNIAMRLQNHDIDTMLIDVSPQYSGNVHKDGRQIMTTIVNAMDLCENFLKKGGNVVCKVLQSQAQPLLDECFKIYFAQQYKYVPSIVRKSSPICFYVLKGYLISENYQALTRFFKQYKGSAQKKLKVVQKYQGKYVWDPIKVIRKQILQNILQMRSQGRSDKDIIKTYATDPYAKVQKTLKLLKQSQQAAKDRNYILQAKINNQLTEGQLFTAVNDFPQTGQEFYEKILQQMQQTVKQNKQKKLQKKQKVSRALLKDDQTYMKVQDKVKQPQKIIKKYLPGDLQGKYSQQMNKQQINLQIDKIQQIHPQISKMINQFQQSQKQGSDKTIEDILKQNRKKYQELSEQSLRFVQNQVEESIKKMTQQSLKDENLADKQIWKNDYSNKQPEKGDRLVNQRRSKRKSPIF